MKPKLQGTETPSLIFGRPPTTHGSGIKRIRRLQYQPSDLQKGAVSLLHLEAMSHTQTVSIHSPLQMWPSNNQQGKWFYIRSEERRLGRCRTNPILRVWTMSFQNYTYIYILYTVILYCTRSTNRSHLSSIQDPAKRRAQTFNLAALAAIFIIINLRNYACSVELQFS